MKKFEMPKLEVIGLSANLACAGADAKGGNFEFATKTSYNKFTSEQVFSAAMNMSELDNLSTGSAS